jgi:dihydroorotase
MKVSIRRPDDFHVHFRDGDMLRLVAPHTAAHFGRALVMPNVPAVETEGDAKRYRARIAKAAGPGFKPLLTIKLTHRTTPDTIRGAQEAGVIAAKLYPEGATTASHDGIRDVDLLWPVFRAMEDCQMALCIHGERPDAFVLDREASYLPTVAKIVRNFPGLKVALEHVTTRAAVEFVQNSSVNVAATITAHHLAISLDDVLGRGIRPHLFCYPVPKTPDDRAELVNAALFQNGGRFFFGSDSAPHPRHAKESACGCAGVYTAPVALAVLAEIFLGDEDRESAIGCRRDALEEFTSHRGADFYGLPRNEGTITLERAEWTVPENYGEGETTVVPFRAGEKRSWRVG